MILSTLKREYLICLQPQWQILFLNEAIFLKHTVLNYEIE